MHIIKYRLVYIDRIVYKAKYLMTGYKFNLNQYSTKRTSVEINQMIQIDPCSISNTYL